MTQKQSSQLPPLYSEAQIKQILTAYRTLFPAAEITPELRNYWGLDRPREWSYVTTDFHTASYDQLKELHQRSMEIEGRQLEPQAKGEALREASRDVEVGFSIGVCPWTDNLLFETFDPDRPQKNLVVVIGHDWYPIGAGIYPESPMLNDGLHKVDRYRHWCPASFFRKVKNEPVIFFANLYPDFRRPGTSKIGTLPKRGRLSYAACMEGLKEVLRILAPKFERTSVISWGADVWGAMAPLIDGGPIVRKLKEQQNKRCGELLHIGGVPYFPMSHPSFGSNHSREHLRSGYHKLSLGPATFDLVAR